MPSRRPIPGLAERGLDLLVAGALTIDRFEDGSTAPGGSVLRAARAAARARLSVAFLTAAGSEPEAQAGLRELATIGELHVESVHETLFFGHAEVDGRRRLSMEGHVRLRPDARRLERLRPRALLLAPVAGELDATTLAAIDEVVEARVRVAALQGWLRRRAAGSLVLPLSLDDLPQTVRAVLRNCDTVVLSHEDLGRPEAEPTAAAAIDVRRAIPGPGVVVTWGGTGYVRADPADPEPFVVRRRDAVVGVGTTGAGDAYAAIVA